LDLGVARVLWRKNVGGGETESLTSLKRKKRKVTSIIVKRLKCPYSFCWCGCCRVSRNCNGWLVERLEGEEQYLWRWFGGVRLLVDERNQLVSKSNESRG